MRIGLFSDTYLPDINGVVTSIETLRKGLIEEGHEVFVVANHSSILSVKYEDNVLLLPGIELKFLFDYNLSGPMNFRGYEIVKSMNLDIIHVHTEFGVGIFARICANQLDIPLVYTYHTTYEDYTHYVNLFNSSMIDSVAKQAVAKLSKILSSPATSIITPSKKTKKMLQGYGITKPINVVPTGIDLIRFDDSEELAHQRQLIRHNYGIGQDSKVFIFVGRIAEEKSISLMLQAFKELLNQQSDVYLLIVGSGPDLDKSKEWVKQQGLEANIYCIGRVENTQIAGFYHAADAFVSASLTETQGLTYIEAMACGLPIFASDMNVLSDLLFEGKTGFFFDDVNSFVDKAKTFLSYLDSQVSQMKLDCRETVKPYDSRIFTKSIVDVYKNTIDLQKESFVVTEIKKFMDDSYSLVLESAGGQKSNVVVNQKNMDVYQIKEDRQLHQNELQELIKDDKFTQIYNYSLDRLTYKDFSRAQLLDILNEKYPEDLESNKLVLSLLEEKGFIDDERLIKELIERQRGKGYGYYRIEKYLAAYSFAQELLNSHLLLLQSNQIDDCTKAIENNESLVYRGSPIEGKNRLTNKLLRDGFESSLVSELMNQYPFQFKSEDIKEQCAREYERLIKRYLKKYDPKGAKHKTISALLNKGFKYETIIAVSQKEGENENN